MSDKILSICIPTFNRKEYLRQTLGSILKQNSADKIDIIISDNASTDGTSEFLQKYINETKGRLNIKYFRNKKNIGGCLNISSLPLLAESEFIRLITDDDVLEDDKNILNNIIEKLSKYSPDAMYLNYNVYDKNLNTYIFKNQLKINKNKYFKNGIDFANSLKLNNYGPIGLMSCNIYKRKNFSDEKFKEIQNLVAIGKEVGYPHLELFLENLNQKSVYLNSTFCIKCRGDNSTRDIGKYFSYQKDFCNIFIRQGIRVNFFRHIIFNQMCFYPFYKLSSLFNGTILYKPLSRIWRHSFYALYLRLIGQNRTNN